MEPNFADLQFNRNHKVDLTAREISKGQKMLIYAFLLNLMVMAALLLAPELGVPASAGVWMVAGSWVLRIATVIVGFFGIFKIAGELGWSGLVKVILFVLLLIPIANLFTLLVVNAQATSFLKKAGYKVGLAGAYQ
jgi:hypothetical protein